MYNGENLLVRLFSYRKCLNCSYKLCRNVYTKVQDISTSIPVGKVQNLCFLKEILYYINFLKNLLSYKVLIRLGDTAFNSNAVHDIDWSISRYGEQLEIIKLTQINFNISDTFRNNLFTFKIRYSLTISFDSKFHRWIKRLRPNQSFNNNKRPSRPGI